MVTIFPSSADSCSQLTSDRVIRQIEISSSEPIMPTSIVVHRHRDHHRHHHGSAYSGSDEQTSQPLGGGERKLRREIANHNERKRMQSINAGFQSLRTLLPRTNSSAVDRLSKAAILQQAVDYISNLMRERQQLIEINRQCMAAGIGISVATVSMNNAIKSQRYPTSSPLPLVKKRRSSDGEDSSSDDSSKPVTSDVTAPKSPTVSAPMAIIRDRLKRRLPSQETTVDCSSADQVAQSLQQSSIHAKDEMAVSSSDDPVSSQQCVSSTDTVVPQNDSSSRTCLSVSRRNLETIVEAIRHLEGDSFYSDEMSSVQSGGDSDRDSDRDDVSMMPMTTLYTTTLEPIALLTAAASSTIIPSSQFSLLRSELFHPLSAIQKL